MSLYNMVQGTNLIAPLLVAVIGVSPGQIPRFRDCWLTDDGETIVLLTRTGGGNREAYEAENQVLQALPRFIRDHDDDYDETFAHFLYAVPDELLDICKQIATTFAAVNKGEDSNGPEASVRNLDHQLNPENAPPPHGVKPSDKVMVDGQNAIEQLYDAVVKPQAQSQD